MIRHADGTNSEAIAKQARGGRIFAVGWHWQKHRVVLTKKEAERVMRVWKAWYERQGWTVRSRGHGNSGYVAYAPDYKLEDWSRYGPDSKVHSVGLHEYDITLQRVYA